MGRLQTRDNTINEIEYGDICIATEIQTKSGFLSHMKKSFIFVTFKLPNFDKLYCHLFGRLQRNICHFTVPQEFKKQVINCLDGQAV